VLIILPFLAIKPNRRAGIWLMLVPFVLIASILLVNQLKPIGWLSRPIAMSGSYFSYASLIIPALRGSVAVDSNLNLMMLASGLCVLCLMTFAFQGWSFIKKFLLGLALLILPGALTLLVYQSGDEVHSWGLPLAYAFLPFMILAGLAVTGKMARKHWNLVLYTILFFCWNYVFMLALRALYVGSTMIRSPSLRPQWWNMLRPRFATSWQGPTALFVVAFLFVLAAFLIPQYRERMKSVFKVVPAPQPQPQQQPASAAAGT